ncbi:TPA: hypothetical protein O8T86_004635, partial [Enterobacter asburiae]|nr:hypothetical protein [Enterobacter asburiae]
ESFPYDVPLNADLVIDTQSLSVEEGVKQVLALLRSRGVIGSTHLLDQTV